MAEKWTNTSSPFSLVMKPKPLASLNHLTLPCVLIFESPFCAAFGDSKRCSSSQLGKSRMHRPTGSGSNLFRDTGNGLAGIMATRLQLLIPTMRCPECHTPYEPNAAACSHCGLLLLNLAPHPRSGDFAPRKRRGAHTD